MIEPSWEAAHAEYAPGKGKSVLVPSRVQRQAVQPEPGAPSSIQSPTMVEPSPEIPTAFAPYSGICRNCSAPANASSAGRNRRTHTQTAPVERTAALLIRMPPRCPQEGRPAARPTSPGSRPPRKKASLPRRPAYKATFKFWAPPALDSSIARKTRKSKWMTSRGQGESRPNSPEIARNTRRNTDEGALLGSLSSGICEQMPPVKPSAQTYSLSIRTWPQPRHRHRRRMMAV